MKLFSFKAFLSVSGQEAACPGGFAADSSSLGTAAPRRSLGSDPSHSHPWGPCSRKPGEEAGARGLTPHLIIAPL